MSGSSPFREPPDHARTAQRLWWRVGEALLPIAPLAVAACAAFLSVQMEPGNSVAIGWSWVPALDVSLSFLLDGLSLLFVMLIGGVGALVFFYIQGYMRDQPTRGRLYAWLTLFMGAMIGLVLSDNIILLFVFWELTSITSFMLIGFYHRSEQARAAATQALLVTSLGGLALLVGLLLLGGACGSNQLSVIAVNGDSIAEHPLLLPIVVLILLGAFTKSAQFPFHFWLPAAMAAPTPVSAYLHSATMVKAGVYLVARLNPLFEGIVTWQFTILVVGGVTGIAGAMMALYQNDLKRILAYSTVSALGTLILLIAVGTSLAIKAALVLLICHALYKAAMFLIVGAVDQATGTREVNALGGLRYAMPMVALAAILAGASKAGIPPAGGFLAKELIYEAALEWPGPVVFLVAILLAINVAFVLVAGIVALKPFWGPRTVASAQAEPLDWHVVAPPVLLATLGLAIGLAPSATGQTLVSPALAAVVGQPEPVELKLWHGWNLPLILSVATLAAGALLIRAWPRFAPVADWMRAHAAWGPTKGYEVLLDSLKRTAAWQTSLLQNGLLRIYLLVVLLSFVGMIGFLLLDEVWPSFDRPWLELQVHELFIPILIVSATLLAVRSSSRLAAVCALGVIGYAVAMLFVMFGAPDLAMTQLAIETLTVILFVLVIYRLPRFSALSSRVARIRDALVAISAGGIMTIVVLLATVEHAPSRVSPFFAENSLEAAQGRNMVNVILVDFRALDTLGEITVLSVAALGILALMRLRTEPSPVGRRPEAAVRVPPGEPLPSTVTHTRSSAPDTAPPLATATLESKQSIQTAEKAR